MTLGESNGGEPNVAEFFEWERIQRLTRQTGSRTTLRRRSVNRALQPVNLKTVRQCGVKIIEQGQYTAFSRLCQYPPFAHRIPRKRKPGGHTPCGGIVGKLFLELHAHLLLKKMPGGGDFVGAAVVRIVLGRVCGTDGGEGGVLFE